MDADHDLIGSSCSAKSVGSTPPAGITQDKVYDDSVSDPQCDEEPKRGETMMVNADPDDAASLATQGDSSVVEESGPQRNVDYVDVQDGGSNANKDYVGLRRGSLDPRRDSLASMYSFSSVISTDMTDDTVSDVMPPVESRKRQPVYVDGVRLDSGGHKDLMNHMRREWKMLRKQRRQTMKTLRSKQNEVHSQLEETVKMTDDSLQEHCDIARRNLEELKLSMVHLHRDGSGAPCPKLNRQVEAMRARRVLAMMNADKELKAQKQIIQHALAETIGTERAIEASQKCKDDNHDPSFNASLEKLFDEMLEGRTDHLNELNNYFRYETKHALQSTGRLNMELNRNLNVLSENTRQEDLLVSILETYKNSRRTVLDVCKNAIGEIHAFADRVRTVYNRPSAEGGPVIERVQVPDFSSSEGLQQASEETTVGETPAELAHKMLWGQLSSSLPSNGLASSLPTVLRDRAGSQVSNEPKVDMAGVRLRELSENPKAALHPLQKGQFRPKTYASLREATKGLRHLIDWHERFQVLEKKREIKLQRLKVDIATAEKHREIRDYLVSGAMIEINRLAKIHGQRIDTLEGAVTRASDKLNQATSHLIQARAIREREQLRLKVLADHMTRSAVGKFLRNVRPETFDRLSVPASVPGSKLSSESSMSKKSGSDSSEDDEFDFMLPSTRTEWLLWYRTYQEKEAAKLRKENEELLNQLKCLAEELGHKSSKKEKRKKRGKISLIESAIKAHQEWALQDSKKQKKREERAKRTADVMSRFSGVDSDGATSVALGSEDFGTSRRQSMFDSLHPSFDRDAPAMQFSWNESGRPEMRPGTGGNPSDPDLSAFPSFIDHDLTLDPELYDQLESISRPGSRMDSPTNADAAAADTRLLHRAHGNSITSLSGTSHRQGRKDSAGMSQVMGLNSGSAAASSGLPPRGPRERSSSGGAPAESVAADSVSPRPPTTSNAGVSSSPRRKRSVASASSATQSARQPSR